MISVMVYQDSNGNYFKFETEGHAEYAEPGQDIVCSAVSALVINAINSIERFTDCDFYSDYEKNTGKIIFQMNEISEDSNLLLKSMLLGLETIQEEYGQDLIQVIYKEV